MSRFDDFNRKLARKITGAVASMWCAYAFAALSLVSLPAALESGDIIVIVGWVAQTFLQLVLLSIIMVGQNAAAASVEKKINETHAAALSEFELAKGARARAKTQFAELRSMTDDIHRIIRILEAQKK